MDDSDNDMINTALVAVFAVRSDVAHQRCRLSRFRCNLTESWKYSKIVIMGAI